MRHLDPLIEKAVGFSTEEAMSIDQANLYERLGEDVFWKLSTEFYERVFNDEEKWFRNIFKGRDQKEATQNQVEFFMQRLGGPPYFSQRKGHPALIQRHMGFNMNEKAAKRWLHHMQEAIDTVEEIDSDSKERMMKYFTHTAYFLSIAFDQMKEQR
ncbi:MAG: truncated hemoglobin family protein [Spirochaetota bacterium]